MPEKFWKQKNRAFIFIALHIYNNYDILLIQGLLILIHNHNSLKYLISPVNIDHAIFS